MDFFKSGVIIYIFFKKNTDEIISILVLLNFLAQINYLILKIESIYPHADNSQNYDVLINHVTLEVFI